MLKFGSSCLRVTCLDDMLLCQTHVSFCPHNVVCVKFREQHHSVEQDNILIHQGNTTFEHNNIFFTIIRLCVDKTIRAFK